MDAIKNKKSRPKWARKLSASIWRHLQEAQETKSPTLTNLKGDLDYQSKHGGVCFQCLHALDLIEGRVKA